MSTHNICFGLEIRKLYFGTQKWVGGWVWVGVSKIQYLSTFLS